jgi:type II secretory ATPase GspE/PulE/Tfp pilus assembly ATPase PilB-like protein
VIAEILEFNDDIRNMLSSGELDLVRQKSKKDAYPTLEYDLGLLVLKGVTSLEEAQRIIG